MSLMLRRHPIFMWLIVPLAAALIAYFIGQTVGYNQLHQQPRITVTAVGDPSYNNPGILDPNLYTKLEVELTGLDATPDHVDWFVDGSAYTRVGRGKQRETIMFNAGDHEIEGKAYDGQ